MSALQQLVFDEPHFYRTLRKVNVWLLSLIAFSSVTGRMFELGLMGRTIRIVSHPENLFWLPLLLSVPIIVRDRRRAVDFGVTGWLILLSVLFGVLAPIWAVSALDCQRHALLVVKALVLGFLIIVNVKEDRDFWPVMGGVLCGATVMAAWGISQYLSCVKAGIVPIVTGNYDHKIHYAGIMEISSALLFALAFFSNLRKLLKFLCGLVFLLHFIALAVCDVRSSLVGFLLAAIVVLGRYRPRVLPISMCVCALGVFLFVLSSGIIPGVGVRVISWDDPSLRQRVEGIWPATIDTWWPDHVLLGVGPGNMALPMKHPERFPHCHSPSASAHNGILQLLWRCGVIGTIVMLAAMIFFARESVRNVEAAQKSVSCAVGKIVGVSCIMMILSRLIDGFVHPFIGLDRRHLLLITIMVALNFIVSLHRKEGCAIQ